MPTNVVVLIKNDHRELERLFEELASARGDRATVLRELSDLLVAHSHAEEQEVYPELVAAEPGEAADVHHGREEHQEATQLLAKLLHADPGSRQFDRLLDELREAVQHHIDEEEEDILSDLEDALTEDELARLGERFAEVRQEELDAGCGDPEKVAAEAARIGDVDAHA